MVRRVVLFFVCFVLLFGFMGCMEPEITMLNVSFNGNGADSDSVPTMVSVKEGDQCTIPTCGFLSKTGYDFKWWNTEPDGSGISYKVSQSFKPNEDITLFAQWEIHSYSISYDLSDGILPEGRNNPFQYTVETDTFTLANPVRDGYKFVGWFDGVETSKDLPIPKGTTGNKSFVAVWRLLNSYEVSYDSNGGEGSIESKYRFENEAVEILQPTNIKKEGFEFNCWNTKADGSGTTYQAGDSYNENQDLKLYAQWSIIRYSISYDLEGGSLSVSNPSEYTIESASFTLNNPTKEGFVFLGWKFKGAPNEDASKDVSVKNGTTGNLSFVAVWRPLNSYSISYNANGGEGIVSTTYKYEGKPITIANDSGISRKGYSFVCWNTRADGTGIVFNPGDSYKDNENLQLYAKWNIIDYTIEYNLNDGELPAGMSNPMKYTVEIADIILVNPTRYGHEFVGWRYKTDSDVHASKSFSIAKGSVGNLSIVAVWKLLESYTISYDLNGGTGTAETQFKYKGESLTISSADTIKRDGYTFSCWNTQRDGKGRDYSPNDAYGDDADLELYAKWNPVNYSIQLNLDGGILTEGSNPIVYTIETGTFSLPIPTKNEHEFMGWKAEGSAETVKAVLIEKGSTGDLSFTAVWRKLDRYTISYDVNGGDGLVESQSKLEGLSIVIAEPAGLERNGYTFECWNTKPDGSGTDFYAGCEYSDDSNLELYAKWSLLRYTISYELGGGIYPEGKSNPNDYTIETETFTLVNPEREGYRFLGWKESGSVDETAMESVSIAKHSTGNKSFVSVWKQLKKYTITYDLNGCDGYIPEQSKYEGDSVSIAQPIGLSRKGYEFVCWNTESDGNGTDYTPGDVFNEDVNLRLHAKWKLVKYSISYDLTGGQLPRGKSNPWQYTVETDTFTLVNPEKENYEFLGWKEFDASDDSAVQKVLIEKGSIGKRRFVAVWKAIPLAFSYDSDTGSYSVKCTDESVTSIVIPSSYRGFPVTEIGYDAFKGCSLLTTISLPDSITSIEGSAFYGCISLVSIIIPEGVSSIGYSAFYNCSSLTNITIPESVTAIGYSAFYKCSSLTSINIPKGVTRIDDNTFYYCSSLTGIITIPSGVTKIGRCAFEGCKRIMGMVLPESVVDIDNRAFEGCSSLSSMTIPSSVTHIGFNAFYGCSSLTGSITIPEGVSCIRNGAFSGCSKLTGITIPKSVTSIEREAFKGCCSMTSIVIPEGVVSIEENTFNSCTGLTSVTIPESVTRIGRWAFSNCAGLKKIVIPKGVESIQDWAFSECISLESVMISSSVSNISQTAFLGCAGLEFVEVEHENDVYYSENNCVIERESKKLVLGCNSSIIPEGIIVIGDNSFSGRIGLEKVTIPESVTSIGSGAFSGCSGLTGKLTIPESVTSIGNGAFRDCIGFTGSLVIPKSVTFVYGFSGCKGFSSVTIPEGAFEIGNDSFAGCEELSSIEIPSSVTRIGECALSRCSKLSDIYYNASSSRWKTIMKELFWDDGIETYTIHCTDTDIYKK